MKKLLTPLTNDLATDVTVTWPTNSSVTWLTCSPVIWPTCSSSLHRHLHQWSDLLFHQRLGEHAH